MALQGLKDEKSGGHNFFAVDRLKMAIHCSTILFREMPNQSHSTHTTFHISGPLLSVQ